MSVASFDIGDLLRIGNQTGTNPDGSTRAAFTNASGVATDPTAVTLQVKRESGTELVYGWPVAGADGTLSREEVGRFSFDVPLDESGLWSWRLAGTGAVETAEEGVFYVLHSAF